LTAITITPDQKGRQRNNLRDCAGCWSSAFRRPSPGRTDSSTGDLGGAGFQPAREGARRGPTRNTFIGRWKPAPHRSPAANLASSSNGPFERPDQYRFLGSRRRKPTSPLSATLMFWKAPPSLRPSGPTE